MHHRFAPPCCCKDNLLSQPSSWPVDVINSTKRFLAVQHRSWLGRASVRSRCTKEQLAQISQCIVTALTHACAR